MKKTGGIASEEDIDRGKGLFHLFDHFHHIIALMVPVKIEGNDPRSLLSDMIDDGKMGILNPFNSHMYDLGGNAMTLEKVGQPKESHGQEIDPDEMIDGPVVISQLGDMKKNTV